MSNYRPVGDKVLIQPDQPEETGLIKSVSKKIPNTGVILAVSPDHPIDVAVGDRVQYSPNHREELEDGTILLSEQNIMFIFN